MRLQQTNTHTYKNFWEGKHTTKGSPAALGMEQPYRLKKPFMFHPQVPTQMGFSTSDTTTTTVMGQGMIPGWYNSTLTTTQFLPWTKESTNDWCLFSGRASWPARWMAARGLSFQEHRAFEPTQGLGQARSGNHRRSPRLNRSALWQICPPCDHLLPWWPWHSNSGRGSGWQTSACRPFWRHREQTAFKE